MPSIASVTDVVSANRLELLQIADSVSREKSVPLHVVYEAIEETIAKAMRSHYGARRDIRAHLDPDSGEIQAYRYRRVVEEVEDPALEVTLEEARHIDPAVELEGEVREPLPLSQLERTGSQQGKQVLHQSVREAERKGQYEKYKDRVGDIITGAVKLVERGNVVIDIQPGEATMRRDQAIPREHFRIGDRVRALIVEVQNEHPGPQVLLSRSSPEYMLKLFAQEVPEVYEGVIEIRAIARDPGSRAKIAVISNNSAIDPVGACVGMRGSRVQTIVNELHGERIDVIPWSPDPTVFIGQALQPARVVEVLLDEENRKASVLVPSEEENQSKAIGRRGQNVRLAAKLTGWQIDILTEEAYSEREAEERAQAIAEYVKRLEVDENEARVLHASNLRTLVHVAEIKEEELGLLEGITAERMAEIRDRAHASLVEEVDERMAAVRAKGVEDELVEFLVAWDMDIEMIEAVAAWEDLSKAEPTIRTLRDFADLSIDELCGEEVKVGGRMRRRIGILSRFGVSEVDAGTLILNARVQLGDMTEEQAFARPAGEDESGEPAAAESDADETEAAESDGGKETAAESSAGEPDGEAAEAEAGEPETGETESAESDDGAPEGGEMAETDVEATSAESQEETPAAS